MQMSFKYKMRFNLLVIIFLVVFPYCGISVKCYSCEFNAAYCHGLNCYNNPDICSSNEFSTALVPTVDCPHNCHLKAITNPAGFVIKWSRNCAPANDLTKGFSCRTEFKFGARIDQCTCDLDYCNNTFTPHTHVTVILVCIFGSLALYQLISI